MVPDAAGRVFDALAAIGQTLGQVLAAAIEAAAGVLGATLSALLRLGRRPVGQPLQTLVTQPGRILSAAVRALIELGRLVVELLEEAAAAIADGVRTMARVLLEIGSHVLELVEVTAVTKKTADVLAAGRRRPPGGPLPRRFPGHGRGPGLHDAARSVVAALFDLGRTFAGLLGELAGAALDVLSGVIKAAIDLGKTVAELVGHVLSRTYRLAARYIEAAIAAGIAAATLLVEVAGGTYWTLRKMVNGILKALGPVGEVLDWALSQAESAVSEIWHRTLAAIRYAGGALTDALDWAAARGRDALEAVVRAWEDIGEALEEVLHWAKEAGETAWEALGTVWTKIENSVSYVLLFLERDFIPGIARFVKGALETGAAIADLAVFIATRPLVVGAEIAKALLAFGATIGQLLVELATHPDRAMDSLMRALDSAGATLRDLYRAAIVETGQRFLKEVSLALQRIGRSITEMLHAVAEVAAGAVATVISHLLNTLASYRPLTAQETAEARDVFEDSVDLDHVFVSSESLLNDVIFGLQDWANGTPDSRAFTTDTLINFDVDDGIERHTLIHELTHVWQALVTGPFYMAEAIHAQTTEAGYNYGYSKPADDNRTVKLDIDFAGTQKELFIGEATGEGGQAELQAANGDFDVFNREQQAQIIMHWFVRKHLLKQPEADYAPWQPFVDVVRAAA